VSSSVGNKPIGLFRLQINFDTNPDRAVEMAALAKKGVADLAQQGPTEAQVQKTIGNMIKRFEENQIQNGFWSSMLLQCYRDHLDEYTQYGQMVKGITAASLKEFARQIVSSGNFVELVMMPK
jgi:zinc protease